ncbi:hypothetical protein [Vibrio cholerae]|uniref:hypothetical protein n=1 Tax=Vibrio cholerae TaxID=666 RepID=UPI0030193FAC
MKHISTLLRFTAPSAEDIELLQANNMQPILLKDLDGNDIRIIHPPVGGWNRDEVNALQVTDAEHENGYDVYLADEWIGSSEM